MRAFCSLVVLVAFSAIPGAADAASGSCAPRSGSIVAQSGGAVIYSDDSRDGFTQFFICSRKFAGRTEIADAEMDSFSNLTTRGRFAAFSHRYFNTGDSADSIEIEIVDLRRHRFSVGARSIDVTRKKLRVCDYPDTSEYCFFSQVGRLFVTSRGSVAFSATVIDEDAMPAESQECLQSDQNCPEVPHYNAIYRLQFSSDLKKFRRQSLDHVTGKELQTLRLAGPRMRWTGHGKPKSAAIR